MKFRKDFVTNSSSSSYVCEICGRECSGYDISLRDYDMTECMNGHVVCLDHINDNMTLEQARDIVKKYDLDICLDDFDTADALVEEITTVCGAYELPPEFCPICSFQNISAAELNKYKNILLDKTNEELKDDVKTRFNNYEEFKQFIAKNKKGD